MANLPDSDAIRADFERARQQINQRVTDALARVATPGAGVDDLVIAALYEARESARRETQRLQKELEEARKPLRFPRSKNDANIICGKYMQRLRFVMPEDVPEWARNAAVIRAVLLALEQLSTEGGPG